MGSVWCKLKWVCVILKSSPKFGILPWDLTTALSKFIVLIALASRFQLFKAFIPLILTLSCWQLTRDERTVAAWIGGHGLFIFCFVFGGVCSHFCLNIKMIGHLVVNHPPYAWCRRIGGSVPSTLWILWIKRSEMIRLIWSDHRNGWHQLGH